MNFHCKEAIDANNKDAYCIKGLEDEYHFIKHIVPQTGEDIQFHSEKENDVYVVDFIWRDRFGQIHTADIKTEKTPFFTAMRYNIDPQYAVTFGLKDMYNYIYRHKVDYVLFRVNWQTLHYKRLYKGKEEIISVKPLHAVWYISMENLRQKTDIELFHPHLGRLVNRNDKNEIAGVYKLARCVLSGNVAGLDVRDLINKDRNDKGNFVYDVRDFTLLWKDQVVDINANR